MYRNGRCSIAVSFFRQGISSRRRHVQSSAQLIRYLKIADPKSMYPLTEVSNKANKVYESFDFRLKEENQQAWTYQLNLDNWRYQLQMAIYQRSNELIKQQPERLRQFGLEKQFDKLHSDRGVPACLVNTQKQMITWKATMSILKIGQQKACFQNWE